MLCGLLPARLAATDNSHEQAQAAALVGRAGPGQVIWFAGDGANYPGIYHQHLIEPAQGAVLILHGMGQHPDWPEVVAPLRLNLPVGGWATLAIQLPVLEPGAALSGYGMTINRAVTRIGAAVSYLQDSDFRNVVIIGYGFGAVAGAAYLADSGSTARAFVGISMQNFDFLQPRLDLDALLARIGVPVLDLYGSRNHGDVLRQAAARRLEAERANRRQYQQIMIAGAELSYTGHEEDMIRAIRHWLDESVP
jgi:hypothetical protein